MADEETLSPGSDTGASPEGSQQGSEQAAQAAEQNQLPERTPVEITPTDASSKVTQARPNNSWANQRILEKTIEKKLEAALSPLMEKLNGLNQPPAQTSQVDETPDYNNLNQWINKRVGELLQQQLQGVLPKQLNQFKAQLQDDVEKTTSMREARNYLLSQKDIGRDEARLAEIRQVMTDNLLDYALEADPIRTTQKAVDIWRKSKTNPNTPTKGQLSTVTGGTGSQGKKELSVQELVALQKRFTDSSISPDERAKLAQQIDSLLQPA